MSDLLEFEIKYDAVFSPRHVEEVLRALSVSVEENWRARDEWSTPQPEPGVNVAGWLRECGPDQLEWSELTHRWSSRSFYFSFSPLSWGQASVDLIKEQDGLLTALFFAPGWLPYEIQGEREIRRMDQEWDRIRGERGEPEPRERGPDEGHPNYDAWWEKRTRLGDTPCVWPQNKNCLRHIIERLCSVFPVRDLYIEEPLQDGEGG
jgi:hypothetical protein